MRYFGVIVFVLATLCVGSFSHEEHPLEKLHMQKAVVDLDASIQIFANPPQLTQVSQWVTVSVDSVPNPNSDDFLAVYSPGNVDYTKHSPVKYQYLNVDSSYLHTGNATLQFLILNMHADVVFVVGRGSTTAPTIAAQSIPVTFSNLNLPLQGHLSFTNSTSEMRLSWATGYTPMSQYVRYGTASGQYTMEQEANSWNYTANQMCGEPATGYGWRDPGYLHTAVMDQLKESQKYFYQYGSDESGWSPEFSFTAPQSLQNDVTVTFATYGDMGKSEPDGSIEMYPEYGALNTTQNLINLLPELDFIMHVGDISYARGYGSEWDEFMNQILPMSSSIAYMTCIGNHERDFPGSGSYYNGTDSGGECGVAYENRFLMPGVQSDKPWYSYEYGNIHFTLMSTEQNFQQGTEQYNWLVNDLQSVDRTKTPWLIFAGHRPMYVDSSDSTGQTSDQGVAKLLQDNIEPLLLKNNVNLVLWGHHHSYERSCPVAKGVCHQNIEGNQIYPVHALVASAGAGLYTNTEPRKPAWLDYINNTEFGYVIVETNADTLTLQWYNNQNQLRDSVVLKNLY